MTSQKCSNGCLWCQKQTNPDLQSVCFLCDASLKYFLSENDCQISDQNFCEQIDWFSGECLLCESGYHIDATTKKCVQVEFEKIVDNCQNYDQSQNCFKCQSQYYLSSNVCEQVTQIVENCLVYSNAITCAQCKVNFYMATDTKECRQIINNKNCLVFSEFQCLKCKQDYLLDYSVYQQTLYQQTASNAYLNWIDNFVQKDAKNEYIVNNNIQVCQKIEIQNCSVHKNFKECQKCQQGFYLKNNQCEKNPQDKIPNCKIYKKETICVECQQGYLLKSQSECQIIKQDQFIEHCQEYKADTSSIICTDCKLNYFLNGNMCQKRQNQTIENCITYDAISDGCSKCQTDFILTIEKFCAIKIQNCLDQISQKSNSNEFTSFCEKCQEGFYLTQERTCQEGTVENCSVYSNGGYSCLECKNEFFLTKTGTCLSHINIQHCLKYSQNQQNICEICDESFYSFEIRNLCIDRQPISNCLEYSFQNDNSICQKCEDNYYLSNNQCQHIPVENCREYQNNKCISCMENFVLVEKTIDENENKIFKCVEPFQYQYQFCNSESNKNNKSNFTKCEFCQVDSFPYRNDENFVCVNESKLDETNIELFYQIEGCVVYDSSGFCIRCQKGKFFKNGGLACEQSCSQLYHAFEAQVTNSHIKIVNNNSCDITLQNDLIKAPSVKNTESITLKCKDWITVSENLESSQQEIQYSNVNPHVNLGQDWVQNPMDVFNSIKCPIKQSLAKIDGKKISEIDTNRKCDLYFDFGFNEYGCIKCPFGERGNYIDFPQPSLGRSSLGTCNSMLTCDANIQYKNINPYWNQFFSCHKCISNFQIPVLVPLIYGLNNPTVEGFSEINKNPLTKKLGEERKLQSFLYYPLMCVNMESEAFIAAELDVSLQRGTSQYINKLIGCGLAVHNPNYTDSNFNNKSAFSQTASDFPQDSQTALFCVACKPGYKAYWWNDFKNVVRFCQKIQNCQQNGSWFDACQFCEDGYVHSYDSSTGIQYDKCVKLPSNNIGLKNCFAYQEFSIDTGECKICQKGFYLNVDKYCEQITSPFCNSDLFQDYNAELALVKNSQYAYYVYQNGYGCTECQGGYFAIDIRAFSVKDMCIVSSYLKSFSNSLNFDLQSDKNKSNFINNCLYYENNQFDITCKQCRIDYLLREHRKECVSKQNAPNCLLLSNQQNVCVRCENGFALLEGGICKQGNILNCQNYFEESQNQSIICKQCNEGHFFEADRLTCKQGKILHCKKYVDYQSSQCEECQDGFALSFDQKYCFENISQMQCKSPLISQQSYECQQQNCVNPWQQLVPNFDDSKLVQELTGVTRGICLQVNKIDNCLSYSQLTFSWNNFECSKCENNFYLSIDKQICLQRKNLTSNCKEYYIDRDQCKICFDDFYLKNLNGNQVCELSPSGAQNCDQYQFSESQGLQCSLCRTGFYLQNNLCQRIPQDLSIENCLIQDTLTTCLECQQNYFLQNNTCIKVQISNCLKLINQNSCDICQNGYRLISKDGNFLCESFNKLNCQVYEQTGDNKCLKCFQHFYPNIEGHCIAAKQQIAECLLYETETHCELCTENYVLSTNKTQCLQKQNYDQNCSQQKLIEDLKCNLCQAGYLITNDQCQQIQANNRNKGCFLTDENDQSLCQICQAGFHMKNDSKCISNKQNSSQIKEKNRLQKLSAEFYMIICIFISSYVAQIISIILTSLNFDSFNQQAIILLSNTSMA